ncbi:MAG: Na(+) H(+) antiporter subunit F [uncultured Frankineae bacterium]|uniref:Na(+) H(+) antiporter subunit F n=1 Tax=uncultured Frankineae bacterium TaxID=437475 RepID=A0A6J4LT18_9ACTN|nr:MAG: Na(+) H(+) antiporter subunit F [uncultured Frankineae bacterium]
MSAVVVVCFAGLALAALLVLVRLLLGPSVPDRIVALDTLLQLVIAGIAVAAATTRRGDFLAVLIAASLLGFLGTVLVGRFVERRGA